MSLKKLLLCFITGLFVSKGYSQLLQVDKPSDSSSIGQLALYDFKQSVNSIGHAFSRPFHWKKKDFTTLGAVAVGSILLSTVDNESSAMFIRNEPYAPSMLQYFGTKLGKPQVYFVTNAALYGIGLFTKNEKIRKTSVLIISSSFTSGIIQSISKTAFGRARPGGDYDNSEFKFWSRESKFHSFPSGHTVLSMTMAHAIAKQFKNPWSKISVYTIGSIAPLSRLFKGAHWMTDIGIGTILSIVVVDSIDNFLFKTKAYSYPQKKNKVSWNFAFSGNKIGFRGRF